MNHAKTSALATNSLFGALLLAASGWGLCHAWAVLIGAGAFIHLLISIPALTMCGLVLYRCSLHWPARMANLRRPLADKGMRPNTPALAWLLTLLAMGIALALLVNSGSLFMLAMAAGGVLLIPWTKISFCRDHFLVSVLVVETGAGVGFGQVRTFAHLMFYPLCALAFFMIAVLALLFVIAIHGNQADRMPVSGYPISDT